MTTDTLTAEVLDEADRIVRAEWLRLVTAVIPQHRGVVRTEMPVTRFPPPKLAGCRVKPGGVMRHHRGTPGIGRTRGGAAGESGRRNGHLR